MFEIGVDIGGTNIKYGLVNEALEIVAHGSIPFPKTTAEDMADKLAAALRAMLAEQGVTEIGSIGIVVPGSIDRSGEVVIAAYNLGFHDVPLRAIMQARFPEMCIRDRSYALLASLADGRKIVTPGFYGTLPDGRIHTFPRGGSDVTGALAAAALRADVYEN